MKKIITLVALLFFATITYAQKNSYSISVGKIKQSGGGRPANGPITETIKITDVKKAQKIYNLVQAIIKNGTEDINKCFIPRDAVLIYEKDKLVTTLLVCFECDGVRINNLETTSVKSVTKREKQMKDLAESMK